MVDNLKSLSIVLILAGLVFHFAKPIATQFMANEDFIRRRNLWLSLTVAAFLAPSFWIYVPIAAVLSIKAVKHEKNPVGLYLLVSSAVPSIDLAIPTVGIGSLFDLNHARLLVITILLPTALSLIGRPKSAVGSDAANFRWVDIGVFGLALLQLLLYGIYEGLSSVFRQGIYFALDGCIIYYVFSRIAGRDKALSEAVICLVLSCALLAPVAVFETLRGWLVYQGIGAAWGKMDHWAWLMRGESLRAQATVGHSLYFGYLMTLGFGFWLSFSYVINRPRLVVMVALVLGAGLGASYSRAPWLSAMIFSIILIVMAPMKSSVRMRIVSFGTLVCGAFLLTPAGGKFIDLLPFVGTVDSGNVGYRQQLLADSINLVLKNPILGDPGVLMYLEHMRQGQGIIDLVNSYLSVALFNGFVGLFFFVLPMVVCLGKTFVLFRRDAATNVERAHLGVALFAAVAATMFFLATCGFNWRLYAVLGLAAAYMALPRAKLGGFKPQP